MGLKIIFRFRIMLCRILYNPLFIIKIEDGKANKVLGTVKSSFIYECEEVCKLNNLKFAFVYAQKSSFGKPVLNGSLETSKGMLQQLRNIWSFS